MMESIEVLSHGEMFDELEEINLQTHYPLCPCPECGDYHTKIKKNLKNDCGSYWTTGHKANKWSNGIFDHEEEIVCYECDVCKCKWVKYYVTKESKWKMNQDFCVFAIFGILSVLTLYIFVMALIAAIELPSEEVLRVSQGIFDSRITPEWSSMGVSAFITSFLSFFASFSLGCVSIISFSNFRGD